MTSSPASVYVVAGLVVKEMIDMPLVPPEETEEEEGVEEV